MQAKKGGGDIMLNILQIVIAWREVAQTCALADGAVESVSVQMCDRSVILLDSLVISYIDIACRRSCCLDVCGTKLFSLAKRRKREECQKNQHATVLELDALIVGGIEDFLPQAMFHGVNN
jgi:hypothetical protein